MKVISDRTKRKWWVAEKEILKLGRAWVFLAIYSRSFWRSNCNQNKLTWWRGTTINRPLFCNIKPQESLCVYEHVTMWVSACVSLCVLYVGYEKAGAAEFSTQEQGRKWCMDNSLFRSSGTCWESTRLNQYRSKLSRVPLLTWKAT